MECPMKYHLVFDHKVPYHQPIREKFNECMRKTILFFYYSLLNENQITQEKLKQKWGQLWFTYISPEGMALRNERVILSNTPADAVRKLELEGASMVINFYRQNQTKRVLPIAVDYSYRIPIGNHVLVDSLELIRQVKDGEKDVVEVVDFKTSEYKPDIFMTTHDLKLTMQVYAYRRLFKMKEQRILYHFLKGGKEIYSYRDDDEMKRFEMTVIAVANAIEKKLFYPNYSYLCNSCTLRMECDNHKL
jgi:hypothetical protein